MQTFKIMHFQYYKIYMNLVH